MTEMSHFEQHLDLVSARLRDYVRVIALPEFEQLPMCVICDQVEEMEYSGETIPLVIDNTAKYRCRCLFNFGQDDCGSGSSPIGFSCIAKIQQQAQFDKLNGLVKANGFEFVDGQVRKVKS